MSATTLIGHADPVASSSSITPILPEPPVGHALPEPKHSPVFGFLAFALAGVGSVFMAMATSVLIMHTATGNVWALWTLVGIWAIYATVLPLCIMASHAAGEWG